MAVHSKQDDTTKRHTREAGTFGMAKKASSSESKTASAKGKNGWQFDTPRCVVRVLVEMLAPDKGRVYDPCCGSAGMFVQSERFVEEHGGRIGDIAVYRQESNSTTRQLSPTGFAGFGLANGSMSSNQSGEGEIRKAIIDADLVDCMVALPGQLFYSTLISVCLRFLTLAIENVVSLRKGRGRSHANRQLAYTRKPQMA